MLRTSVIDLLEDAAVRRPRHVAVVDREREVSYEVLLSEVARTARLLEDLGVGRRDRVGIYLPKSLEEVVSTLAIAALRGVFVNINYQWTIEQLEHIVRDAGIRVLITDGRRARQLRDALAGGVLSRLVVVDDAVPGPACVAWRDRPGHGRGLARPLGSDLAALLYTSGSTGRPKGVMVTQQMLVRGAEIVATYLANTADDRVLSVPPLSFDYGLNQLTTMLLVAGTLVLQRVALPTEIARTASAAQVTAIPLVAPSWVQLVRYLEEETVRFEALRYVTNTGGAIPRPILETMPRVLPGVDIFLMFGLTEAFRSTYLPPRLFHAKLGAIGQAIPNVEIFVVHPDSGLCGPDEVGELVHRGDLISSGYWGQPEATASRIRVNEHLRPALGEEPVLHSGDWVRRDADGILWYVGRMDSMIKCSGFRISPNEVEDVVCRFPGVDHAVAFGVKDDELGQVVHVAVQWREGARGEDALRGFLREHLPHYMLPRAIHGATEPMPRTATGKIDRQAVIGACHLRETSAPGPLESEGER
jgi:acyl-CoA synthetase (AMP-forming)/AMP-acid ligase II